jgi:Methyltransferase domain
MPIEQLEPCATAMSAKPVYAQFGCGFCAPPEWLNFDASPTLRLERIPILGRLVHRNARRFPDNVFYGDIVKGLPVTDGSCSALFGSHILEHLSLADFRTALGNAHRHLCSGGILRVIVPDLEAGARTYLSLLETNPSQAAEIFIRSTVLGEESRPSGLARRLISSVSNARHRWMWDYPGLAHELKRAGFRAIRRCSFGDSEDARFREVEDAARFEGSIGVECRR